MSIDLLLILTLVAMLAGCIDAIAGGGGLITLPALLLVGVPPVSAIATNKLQATAGSFSSTLAFARQGAIEWRRGIWIALASFTGGVLGAYCVSLIPAGILQVIIPILLLFVAFYFIVAPKLDENDQKPRIPYLIFTMTIVPLLGFYDGLFGPGVGSFFMVAFIALLGKNLLYALAHTKLANFACNIGSLLFFLTQGNVLFIAGLCMAIGAFIGAQIGARYAVRLGARLIKPLLIIMCCAMAIKLLFEPDNPIHQWLMQLSLMG